MTRGYRFTVTMNRAAYGSTSIDVIAPDAAADNVVTLARLAFAARTDCDPSDWALHSVAHLGEVWVDGNLPVGA